MTYLEMLKPGYQKNWGTLKAAITLHSSPKVSPCYERTKTRNVIKKLCNHNNTPRN